MTFQKFDDKASKHNEFQIQEFFITFIINPLIYTVYKKNVVLLIFYQYTSISWNLKKYIFITYVEFRIVCIKEVTRLWTKQMDKTKRTSNTVNLVMLYY